MVCCAGATRGHAVVCGAGESRSLVYRRAGESRNRRGDPWPCCLWYVVPGRPVA